jgi:GT2 family glycosyltransferase
MIASFNRRDELLNAIGRCFAQDYADKEVHVVDDGSTDGTFEAVRSAFPTVIISRNEQSCGSVHSRNQIFERVTGDILIGFDDDSWFVEPDSTSRVVERFVREPDLGILEFQDIGPEFPERIDPASPGRLNGGWHVSSFGGGRYALRRSVLEKTGLFPAFFWHAYEEPDLAWRVWNVGYRCMCWNDIIVWHDLSERNRSLQRRHYFQARNALLSTWLRVPPGYLLPLTVWRMWGQWREAIRNRWWTIEFKVWFDALCMLPDVLRNRQAVKPETVRRCLLLNRRKVIDPAEAWALGR